MPDWFLNYKTKSKIRAERGLYKVCGVLVFIFFIFFGLQINTASATASWYDYAWGYRTMITIDHNQVASSTGTLLTNFPVLVSTTTTALKYTSFTGGHMGTTTGADIFFTSSDGTTALNYEIEKYASSTGELVAWVKIPSLATSTDTDIYLYYGNASASTPTASVATGVWDDGGSNYFKGVWHLPNIASASTTDSTSNIHNGSATGNASTTISGNIDGSFIFDGSGDTIVVPDSSDFYLPTNFTMGVWVNAASAMSTNWWTSVFMAQDQGGGGSNKWIFSYNPTGGVTKTVFHINDSSNIGPVIYSDAWIMSLNTWYYLVITKSGNTYTFYKNGDSNGTTVNTFTVPNPTASLIFGYGEGSGSFNGKIDEYRISSSARSADWIKTEYNNQVSSSTFLTFGEESLAPINITWDGSASTDWAAAANWDTGTVPTANDNVIINGGYTNAPTLSVNAGSVTVNSLTIGSSATSTLTVSYGTSTKKLIITGNLNVGPNGILKHADNSTTEAHSLWVDVGGNLTIDSGGTINVDELGYDFKLGPGAPLNNQDEGGSYGGLGADGSSPLTSVTYGSITAPINLGSGGYGPNSSFSSGGGAIKLTVTGEIINNGTISAKGDSISGVNYAGGSGGSIYITAGSISGAGEINAKGGDTATASAGGGGGRISVILTGTAEDFTGYSGTVTAFGGTSLTANKNGAAGTVYLQTQAQGTGQGTLVIDNNNYSTATWVMTSISSLVTNTTVGAVTLTANKAGKFTIDSGQTLTIQGTSTTVTIGTGTILTNNGTLNLGGTGVTNNGTLTFGANSTINYIGQNDDVDVTIMDMSYQNIGINNSGTTFLVLADTLNVGSNLTVTAGTLDASTTALVLDGGDQTVSLNATTTFESLTKIASTSSQTLTFGTDGNLIVTATTTLQGTADYTLSLRSATEGEHWYFQPDGSRDLAYLDVQDSYNVSDTVIDATDYTSLANSGNNINWVFSSPVTIGKSGTQTATTSLPVTGLDLGGAFTLLSTGGNATVGSIKLKQIGSFATSSLSNISLYYKEEETCSSTKPAGASLFGIAGSFDNNSIATTTGELILSSGTQTCLYITYDLLGEHSTSTLGQSIDFEITNPSTDIVTTGGTVSTTSRVNISGRTIVTTNNIISLLSLKSPDQAKDPTVYYLQNNAIWKMEGGGTPVRLTNPNLKVHSFTFTDLTGANSSGTVRMQIVISNVDQGADPSFLNVTKTYSTTATVRSWTGND